MPGGAWGEFNPRFVDHLTEQIQRYPNLTLIMEDRIGNVDGPTDNEKYQAISDGKVVTQKGVEVPCDLLFWCTGGRVNYNSYQGSQPAPLCALLLFVGGHASNSGCVCPASRALRGRHGREEQGAPRE